MILVGVGFIWWDLEMPGRYLYESSPGDSFGSYGAWFIDVARDGSGTMWKPKDNWDDSAAKLHFANDFRSFTIAGIDPFRLRTTPATTQRLVKRFAKLDVTITSDASLTSDPRPRTYSYSKVFFFSTVTLEDVCLLGLLLVPCSIWLGLGGLIESAKGLKIWLIVSFLLLAAYCFVLYIILGFSDMFHLFPKFSWMPLACFTTSLLGLRYLKKRIMNRIQVADHFEVISQTP